MDGLSSEMKDMDLSRYWREVGKNQRQLTKSDMHHICDCHQCQIEFLKTLHFYHLKVTPGIMAAITADDFKQQVVRALCLRAVAAGVGN